MRAILDGVSHAAADAESQYIERALPPAAYGRRHTYRSLL
jgi:hypothetical protein